MLRRTGFKRAVYERAPRQPLRPSIGPRGVYAQSGNVSNRQPKEDALQHEAYMDAVRSFTCARCGARGPSQFCHADEGKGQGIKTDCRRGWPGCVACHVFVGSTGRLGKEGRRAFEEEAGAVTRQRVLELGLWPASLPHWT